MKGSIVQYDAPLPFAKQPLSQRVLCALCALCALCVSAVNKNLPLRLVLNA
jgi:hypothetical protein